MFNSLGNRIIFPAPPSSYDKCSYRGNLHYIPWNLGRPGEKGWASPAGADEDGALQDTEKTSGRRGRGSPPAERTNGEDRSARGGDGPQSPLLAAMTTSALQNPDHVAGPGLPALWFPTPANAATVVLYLHGNAEDLGMSFCFLKHMTAQFRVGVLAVEYPGYGLLAKCEANEENLYQAAHTALRFLVDTLGVRYKHVILMGRSIGSGPACYLASKFPIGGLLLVAPFASIR